MTLKNIQELANTREKLEHLEARYEQLKNDRNEDARIRDLSMHSLKKLINQLKEEIAVFKAHQPAAR